MFNDQNKKACSMEKSYPNFRVDYSKNCRKSTNKTEEVISPSVSPNLPLAIATALHLPILPWPLA